MIHHQVVLLWRAKRKSLAMTAIVSVCFAVCWLPWCVSMMLLTFGVNIAGGDVETNNILENFFRFLIFKFSV